MKLTLDARSFSITLLALIVISIAVGIGGVVYLQRGLSAQAEKASTATSIANQSTQQLENAQALQSYLKKHTDETVAAAKIVADAKSYSYQNQIVNDLNSFAKNAGVTITGFTFSQTIETVKPDATGLKPLPTNVTLADNTPYNAYRSFLKLIEQNKTKMQITTVNLTPDAKNPAVLNDPTLVVEVYVNSL